MSETPSRTIAPAPEDASRMETMIARLHRPYEYQPRPEIESFRRRIHSYYQMFNRRNDPASMRLGWDIPKNGYRGMFDTLLKPQIMDGGVRGFLFHLPYGIGSEPPDPMDWDAFNKGRDRDFTKANDLTQVLSEMLDDYMSTSIAYLGSIESMKGTSTHAWIKQVMDAAGGLLGIDCDVVMDRSATHRPGVKSALVRFMNDWKIYRHENHPLRSTMMIEPWPLAYATHLHDMNVCMLASSFLRSRPAREHEDAFGPGFGDSNHYAGTRQVRAKRIVLMMRHRDIPMMNTDENAERVAWSVAELMARDPRIEIALPIHYWLFDRNPRDHDLMWRRNERTLTDFYEMVLEAWPGPRWPAKKLTSTNGDHDGRT